MQLPIGIAGWPEHWHDEPVRYWSTAQRPVPEQFSYWREVICEAFTPLAPHRDSTHRPAGPREQGISSWVRSAPLTSINCAEVSSTRQLITHGHAEVRRTDSAQVFVNLQLRGRCVVSQGGRRCIVPTGSFAMVDTTAEYRLELVEDPDIDEWRILSFRVPHEALLPLLADPVGFTAVTHDTSAPATNLAVASMLSIWHIMKGAAGLDGFTRDAAETAFTTMLAAGVGAADGVRESGRASIDAGLRAAVNRYLAANLRHADLTASVVARRFGISVRTLHVLYEGTGRSYRQTIMELRVDRCANELAAGTTRSMTDLATRWGFYDLSHLNRVFRAHRGCLPSEYSG